MTEPNRGVTTEVVIEPIMAAFDPHTIPEPLGEKFDLRDAHEVATPPNPVWAVSIRPHDRCEAKVIDLEAKDLLSEGRLLTACLRQLRFWPRLRAEYRGRSWHRTAEAILELATPGLGGDDHA